MEGKDNKIHFYFIRIKCANDTWRSETSTFLIRKVFVPLFFSLFLFPFSLSFLKMKETQNDVNQKVQPISFVKTRFVTGQQSIKTALLLYQRTQKIT